MRAYFYTPEECGMSEFPPGLMRLQGAEQTRNPDEADVFVVPCGIYHLGVDGIKRLPHLKGNERKHTGLNISDWFKTVTGVPGMWVRCDATRSVMEREPTTIPWPWPVEDLGAWHDRPFEKDIVFVGWNSTDENDVACESVLRIKSLDSLVQRKNEFYGWVPQSQDKEDSHKFFIDTLAGSRLSLCVRSIPDGVWRYRAWEAISVGRVFVHICDGIAYPWNDKIDYSVFMIHVPESDASHTGEIVADWLSKHDDNDIRERGRYARQMYERYLCRDRWDSLFAEAIPSLL